MGHVHDVGMREDEREDEREDILAENAIATTEKAHAVATLQRLEFLDTR
jgi:hypothetical protein